MVTLPKVTSVDQVEAMTVAAECLEKDLSLPSGALRFELQVETPQAVLGSDGTVLVARMIHASAGRCAGLHYGTYDYSADLGISPDQQSLEHPVADHAKAVMQAAAAGTGVRLSDGSTNLLPVGDADAVRADGPTTCAWSGGPWNAASTRAGTCTRPSCPRGTPPPSSSSAAASSPRSNACAPTR